MKFLYAGFAFIFCFLIISAPAGALQETTISASPAILDLAAKPGESTYAEITVRNGGEVGLPISIVPKSLATDEDIFVNKDRTIPDASKWIEVNDSEFILSPNELKKVPIIINTPDYVSAGGYYAELSIRGLSLEPIVEQGTSIVVPEISIIVLLTAAGDTYSSMEISSNNLPVFSTPRTDYISSFYIINSGNTHDLVSPEFVATKSGREIYRQRLSSNIILPNLEKNFLEKLQLPDTYGVYDAYIEFSYNNGQIITKSNVEKLIVTPPLKNIILIGFLTILTLYIFNHRKNLRSSWNALTKS